MGHCTACPAGFGQHVDENWKAENECYHCVHTVGNVRL